MRISKSARRLSAMAAAIALLGVWLPTTQAEAAGGHSGYCTTADKNAVTIVVDFQGLGGKAKIYCATGLKSGATGIDALRAAKVSIKGTATEGLAFLCRIAGRPKASEKIDMNGDPEYQEKCADTPPGDAYWSYWEADAGGSWSYNPKGAQSHKVKIGGYEGWSFAINTGNQGKAPSVSPAKYKDPPKAKAKPKATKKPTPKATPTKTATATPSATPSPEAEIPTPTPTELVEPEPAPDDTADSYSLGDEQAVNSYTSDDSGDPTGVIIAVASIAVLITAASVVALRRRRK
ncbi:MAG: hypothetical protein LBR58_07025 [Propionibacteriaceae bacterium]|jgi:hypothetical protein|nr:hypothetical protein [Propionibacteriaceae bacterium]